MVIDQLLYQQLTIGNGEHETVSPHKHTTLRLNVSVDRRDLIGPDKATRCLCHILLHNIHYPQQPTDTQLKLSIEQIHTSENVFASDEKRNFFATPLVGEFPLLHFTSFASFAATCEQSNADPPLSDVNFFCQLNKAPLEDTKDRRVSDHEAI